MKGLGEVSGVAVDSNDDLFVFHRADRVWTDDTPPTPIAADTIHVYSGRTGEFIRSFGARQFVVPHGLFIDSSDHLWLTDVGSHQILKLAPDGTLLMTIGEGLHFNQPTGVVVMPDGDLYVSDGYINTRIVRLDAQGNYISEWGELNLPHG